MYLGAVWIQHLKLLVVNERKGKEQRISGVIKANNNSVWGHVESLWVCMCV